VAETFSCSLEDVIQEIKALKNMAAYREKMFLQKKRL